MLWILRLAVLGLGCCTVVASAATADEYSAGPIYEASSTGLITLSRADRALRVAVTFTEDDDAAVDVLVRFLDQRGEVLQRHRGTLRNGEPVVANLSRRDLGHSEEMLVRPQVILKLPGVRDLAYPILITAQPIANGGFGRFVLDWGGGGCGCPIGFQCGPPINPGRWYDCTPPIPVVLEF